MSNDIEFNIFKCIHPKNRLHFLWQLAVQFQQYDRHVHCILNICVNSGIPNCIELCEYCGMFLTIILPILFCVVTKKVKFMTNTDVFW